MNNTALQIRETDSAAIMPAMSIQDAVDRHQMVVQFVGAMLKSDIDYGVIPGTNKPTLLKPGAEKLLTFFGLTKRFTVLEKVEDWRGGDHGGPFFYYMYRCALYNGDRLIAESDGSCNSHESKYRWRKAERECPTCGKAAIIKGRDEYGGGWVCFKKKDGCGAKFRDGDASIEGQQVGRVENPDMADLVNTIQKMAQKRALIAATLLAVNASEFFTQDLEDMAIEAEIVEVKPEPINRPWPTKAPEPHAKTLGDLVTPKQLWTIRNLGRELGMDVERECKVRVRAKLEEISKPAADKFINYLKDLISAADEPTPEPTKAPEPIEKPSTDGAPTVTATEFWKSVRKWKVPEEESSNYAQAAISKEITWAEALNTLREMYG
jgi:hypothetical protein